MNYKTPPQPPKPRGRKPKREDVSDCDINLRVTRDRKRSYRKAAEPGSLSDWATRHLDQAANYPEGAHPPPVEKG